MRPLADTPVTPNQLTTVRLLTGVGAALLLAEGSHPVAGAVLFIVSMLFDRADGELARLSGKSSAWGHTYDLITDAVCNALVLAGLGVGLRHGSFGWLAVPMGAIAGLAVAAILWIIVQVESREGQRSAELAGRWGFDVDDAMFVVPLMVLAGWLEPLLIAAAAGAPAFAAFMFWRFHARLRGEVT